MSDDKKTRADASAKGGAQSQSRRNLLKGVGLTGAALMTAGSGSLTAQTAAASASPQRIPVREAFETLTALESATLDAFASRIIPSDESGPGAHEARAVHYIDRALAGAMSSSREQYGAGLSSLEDYSLQAKGMSFHLLPESEQDAIIEAMIESPIEGYPILNGGFFFMVRTHTIDGTFSDPYYGGNRDFIGWDLLGYPGVRAVATPDEVSQGSSLAPSRQSAYDMPTHLKDPVASGSSSTGGAANGH
ncbi:MAG: gluconate 2-dehydrogenase subunit 3 family protein [Gammaproteobacteria bacterium]